LANRPQAAGGFNPELEPTRGWTYESGLRGRALGRLGWELTAFRTELRDELVPFEVPSAPGRTFFRNAGRSRHQGFEASVRAALAGGISARAAYTRVDARFRTAAGDAEAGNWLPGRAPHHLAAVLQLDRRVVSAALDVSWTDAVPVDDANTSEAPSHTLVGLRVSAPDLAVAGRVSASPFVAVRNLFDEDHVGSVVPNAFLGRFFEPGPGREVRLGLSLTF
jgi:iron complex outermembrane receptor protein